MKRSKLVFFSRLTIAIIVAGGIAIIGWRQYTRNWIAKRHAALEWADSEKEGLRPGIGIGYAYIDRLPFSLRFWSETRAVWFISVDLDSMSELDRERAHGLETLFPEAEIRLHTHKRDGS